MEENITNNCFYAFSFFISKHHQPQSINAKLFLPLRPIDIVAYAFILLWDNLCRNSCIENSLFANQLAIYNTFAISVSTHGASAVAGKDKSLGLEKDDSNT